MCKLLPYCSWAVKERRSELYPQTCSFDGYMPVVCCPYTRTHDPPHLPLRPTRPILAGVGPSGVALVVAEVPVMETPINVGGLLGPLPPPQPSRPGHPDQLQQEVGVLDRLLGIIELSDGHGSALFARRGRTRTTSTSTTTSTTTAAAPEP